VTIYQIKNNNIPYFFDLANNSSSFCGTAISLWDGELVEPLPAHSLCGTGFQPVVINYSPDAVSESIFSLFTTFAPFALSHFSRDLSCLPCLALPVLSLSKQANGVRLLANYKMAH
jgi:hypothetical protein